MFGTHERFATVNSGSDSRLTDADRADLARLYEEASSGRLPTFNGTPVRLVLPFERLGREPGGAGWVSSFRRR